MPDLLYGVGAGIPFISFCSSSFGASLLWCAISSFSWVISGWTSQSKIDYSFSCSAWMGWSSLLLPIECVWTCSTALVRPCRSLTWRLLTSHSQFKRFKSKLGDRFVKIWLKYQNTQRVVVWVFSAQTTPSIVIKTKCFEMTRLYLVLLLWAVCSGHVRTTS